MPEKGPIILAKIREAEWSSPDEQGGVGEIILIPTYCIVHGKPAPVQVFLGSLVEPIRLPSPHRINLEEPIRVASPTRIDVFLCL
jgi:hypothetical protein